MGIKYRVSLSQVTNRLRCDNDRESERPIIASKLLIINLLGFEKENI